MAIEKPGVIIIKPGKVLMKAITLSSPRYLLIN